MYSDPLHSCECKEKLQAAVCHKLQREAHVESQEIHADVKRNMEVLQAVCSTDWPLQMYQLIL